MSDTSSTVDDVEYLTPREAAKALSLPSVTARTLRAWAHAGQLPVLQLPSGRMFFRREDIEALLEPQRAEPQSDEAVPPAPVGRPGSSPDDAAALPGQGALL
ncbi:helix-turn-helix domain-containing protein [Actinomyces wuliandei]|uniref:helix-turn-helix domain-containing protein n=1 Tax=Actinomyces wuliandei TaxID=2057743 RepID=UPI00111A34DA|nr:helix-turn-helix domain-containing protein [Actinomyces wuliandei]